MKKAILLILTLCATSALFAQIFADNGINYNVTSPTTVEVTFNPGFIGDAVIPSSVTNAGDTYSVTSISDGAFYECADLTSVDIPNSVTSIGQIAFAKCIALASVNIPNSVTSIGDGAFGYCSALTSVNIPDSVTSIGNGTFGYCSALTSVNIPNSVTSIGNGTFGYCSALTSVNIPNSVTSIGDGAFGYCSSLTSVNIPNSVTSIGDGAFGYCTALTAINIPNSVTSIGDGAFGYCTALTAIDIPESVTSIGDGAFGYCTALTAIDIPESVISIGEYAFGYCGALTSVNIPNLISSIGKGTFAYCSALTSVNIPNSVTSIGDSTFAYCSALTSINIPNSVTSIGEYAFTDCTSLTSITVDWATPLVITANVLENVPSAPLVLYVPSGTTVAYQEATGWGNAGTITEGTLPLTLTNLTAKAIATGNQINWVTANINNVKNITLERSGANNNFSPLVILPSTAVQYIDNNPLSEDNYYRLSSTDNDGTTQTYPLTAFVKGLANDVSFYPNPVTNGMLNVVAGSYKIESVALFDLNGRKVVFVNVNNNSQNLAIPTQGLAKGIYVLEIKGEKTSTTKKVVVN